MTRRLIFALLATLAVVAVVRFTIFDSKDQADPVVSGPAASDAKVVDLPLPDGVVMPRPAPPMPAASGALAARYISLTLVSPVNGGMLHSNDGAFELRVRLSPELKLPLGDHLRVWLDGKELPGSFRETTIRIADADWQLAASPADGKHTLRVTVQGSTGSSLIESPVTTFHVNGASVPRAR